MEPLDNTTTPIDRAEINRQNAQHSTGPRTEHGKRRSSLNALRHGLTGQVVVLPYEDLKAYENFTKGFHREFEPEGVVETQLVQTVADDYWRLNRAKAMENNLYTLGLQEQAERFENNRDQVRDALGAAAALRENTKALATLSMHQNRINRSIEKNMAMLRQLQAERRAHRRDEMVAAAKLYTHHQEQTAKSKNPNGQPPTPYNPTQDGFVFSTDQIQTHIERQQRREAAHCPSWAA